MNAGTPQPRRRLIAGAVVIVALCALAIVIPRATRSLQLRDRLVCVSRLKGFAAALNAYGFDPADPRDPVRQLIDAGHLSAEDTVCPVTGRPYLINKAWLEWVPEKRMTTTVVAFEPLGNHVGGAHAAYGDGHASFEHTEVFETLALAGAELQTDSRNNTSESNSEPANP